MMENIPPAQAPPSAAHAQMFAVVASEFIVIPATMVLEMLDKNAQANAKTNLLLGPIFRAVEDGFRDWSRIAEPGWVFQAPEIALRIIRLATAAPLYTSMSKGAQEKIEQSGPESDGLRIVRE